LRRFGLAALWEFAVAGGRYGHKTFFPTTTLLIQLIWIGQ
jgi:hypothetical protein